MIGIDRAVLGRQRDLAGARRRRIVGGVPARLCGDHVGALSAGDRDAAGAGVPRRRLRIPPRGRDQQALLEFRLHRRLRARRDLPGRDPGRADPGHRRQRRRLRRRCARLGDAVRADVRARRARRLWPARRHLAGDEDRRRGRRARQAARQAPAARRARLHGDREPVDAARVRADRHALVHDAEHLLFVAGAARHRRDGVRAMALARGRTRDPAVPRRDRAVPVRLRRDRDFGLSLSGAAVAHDLGYRGRAVEPALHADRDAGAAAGHPRLFVFVYWVFRGKVRRGEGYHH